MSVVYWFTESAPVLLHSNKDIYALSGKDLIFKNPSGKNLSNHTSVTEIFYNNTIKQMNMKIYIFSDALSNIWNKYFL